MMGLYDDFLESVKSLRSKLYNDPATMDNVSGALAAELTIIVSLLLFAILLRHISIIATVVVFILVVVLLLSNLPVAPKFKMEQSDSLEKMSFYIIVSLGIIVSLIYWGLKYV